MRIVRDVIQCRAKEKSTPRSRTDNFHVALVVEGGGMRGVVAGGMVSALEERCLVDCFDSVHGASAGACAGAYFLTNQASLGTSIYYEDINNKQFISILRPILLRPIMNADFLIDYVMQSVKVLDVDKLITQIGRLNIVTTEADTGQPRIFNRFTSAEHFFRALKASITIPLIAGRWVILEDRKLVDGGMTQQIALQSAVDAGATHILVLMTHRCHELIRPSSDKKVDYERWLIKAIYGQSLADCYSKRNNQINKTVQTILKGVINGIALDYIARPSESVLVSRLCTDAEILRMAASQSRQIVHKYFD
jgi:predicted patatin/cPLA2 family phospholipase